MFPNERKPCTVMNMLRFLLARLPSDDHMSRTCVKRLMSDLDWKYISIGKGNPLLKIKDKRSFDGAALLDGLYYMQAYLNRKIEICGSATDVGFIWHPHIRIFDREGTLTIRRVRHQFTWTDLEPYFLPLSVAKVDTMLISRSCKWRLREKGVSKSILSVLPTDRQYDSMRGILYVGEYTISPIQSDYVGKNSIIVRMY